MTVSKTNMSKQDDSIDVPFAVGKKDVNVLIAGITGHICDFISQAHLIVEEAGVKSEPEIENL